jgi:RNA polymerase sigma factor (sigma-70 family)
MTLTLSKTSRHCASGETDLVAASRAGDDRAFEELYSRYRDRILAFIVSKVHDHGRAEDIAQDVFMSALRRMRSNDQHIAFKPWIYEIAKNACIDEFRRGSRSREVPLESDGEFVTDRQATLGVVSAPAAAIESKQRLDDLRGAFGGLSANHHQLLLMREFEGMSYDEIGQRLDMTRQMVESGLFRARRKLSEEYEELASGRRCAQIQTAIEAGTMQSVSALGLRERRRFARHLSHCQPCRHAALMAGVDEALVKPRSIAAKIAAFLPFPLVRWPWGGGRGRGGAGRAGGGSHHLAAASSLPNAAPAASSALGPAAAAVAVLALAGAGAGIGHGLFGGGPAHRSLHAAPAADHTALSSTGSSGSSGAASSGSSSAAGQRLAHGQATLAGSQSALRSAGRSSSTTRVGHAGSSGGAAGASGAGGGSASSPAHGGSAASGVARSISDVQSKLGGAAAAAGSTLSGTTQALGHTVQGVGSTVQKATKTVDNVVNGATGTVNKTVDGVTGAANKLTGGALAPVTGAANSAVNGATSAINSAASGATTTAGNVVKGATSAAGNALSGLGAAGSGSTGSGSGSSGSGSGSSGSGAGSGSGSGAGSSSASSTVSNVTKPVTSVVSKTLGGL